MLTQHCRLSICSFVVAKYSVSSILGTTIPDLSSSIDYVVSNENIHVISDVINSVLGREEYLVHYLRTTPPGYCVLRPMREEAGIPVKDIPKNKINEHNLVAGVVCLTHERLFSKSHVGQKVGHVIQQYDDGEGVTDNVIRSLHLPKLPTNLLNDWFSRTADKEWPSKEVREEILRSDCFLVPVGHIESICPQVEFRFTFSTAERHLMLSLNITQRRCLTLMKILNKTFIEGNPKIHAEVITFYYKTALWFTAEETGNEEWDHDNILSYTARCLKWLKCRIGENFLPNYFLPNANLLEEQLDEETRDEIVRVFSIFISSPQDVIGQILLDDIGQRFLQKNAQMVRKVLQPPGEAKFEILNQLVGYHIFKFLIKFNSLIYANMRHYDVEFNLTMIKQAIDECKQFVSSDDLRMQEDIKLILPMLCTIQGCLLGVQNSNRNLARALKAEEWLILGKDSDMTSGKLKLASAYYSYGDYKRAVKVLQDLEDDYSAEYVMRVCGCRPYQRVPVGRGFYDGTIHFIDDNILHLQCAYCVVFTRSEKPCVPSQFQIEMYRSSAKELKRRTEDGYWMDWSCVDSYPYLFFLQYLTYDALSDRKRSLDAFRMLKLLSEDKSWYHGETVFNLLGQCYEKEGYAQKALTCYRRSTEIMPNNNAATALKRKLRS